MRVAAQVRADTGRLRPRQVGGHQPGRATREGAGTRRHPSDPDRRERGQAPQAPPGRTPRPTPPGQPGPGRSPPRRGRRAEPSLAAPSRPAGDRRAPATGRTPATRAAGPPSPARARPRRPGPVHTGRLRRHGRRHLTNRLPLRTRGRPRPPGTSRTPCRGTAPSEAPCEATARPSRTSGLARATVPPSPRAGGDLWTTRNCGQLRPPHEPPRPHALPSPQAPGHPRGRPRRASASQHPVPGSRSAPPSRYFWPQQRRAASAGPSSAPASVRR
ncbi:hypothetical protein SDIAM103S_02892 [Streptomyces diastaticus subsp. diastaticus]